MFLEVRTREKGPMSISRENHFLPQMYLKRWSEEGKIKEYKLLVSHENVPIWTIRPIRKAAVQGNLYVRIEDGVEYDDIEHWFDKHFENPAARALEKACNGEKMTSEDWSKLIDFVIAQYVRTPAFHQWTMEMGKTIVPSVLDEVAQKIASVTPEEIKSHKNREDDYSSLLPLSIKDTGMHPDEDHTTLEISTMVGKNMWLMDMKYFLSEKSVVNRYIHSIKWSIVSSPEDSEWPTCDSPFIIAQYNAAGNFQIVKDGIGNNNALVFPLSPNKVLLGTRTRKFDWRFTADDIFFNEIKALILNNAYMYVYSREEDDSIPHYRQRVVNEELFKKVMNEYSDWYDKYQEAEAPYLTQRRTLLKPE